MAEISEALRGTVTSGKAATVKQAINAFGRKGSKRGESAAAVSRRGRRAFAEAIAAKEGISVKTAQRRIQRATAGPGKQQRSGAKKLAPVTREIMTDRRAAAAPKKIAKMQERGGTVRLRARIQVSKEKGRARDITVRFEPGEFSDDPDEFEEAFFEAWQREETGPAYFGAGSHIVDVTSLDFKPD